MIEIINLLWPFIFVVATLVNMFSPRGTRKLVSAIMVLVISIAILISCIIAGNWVAIITMGLIIAFWIYDLINNTLKSGK